MVQVSYPYMTTGKTIALIIQTFVSKVMSLLFNMLSRFVIAFLPKSKQLLISRLQSPSAVILEPKKIKSLFPFFPHFCHNVKGLDALLSEHQSPHIKFKKGKKSFLMMRNLRIYYLNNHCT